jgi:hypothetical protein
MKKYLFILAAAAALVACSKTELVPAVTNDAETEITYTVAPKVRADVKDFNTGWKFMSYAFYLGKDDEGNAQAWADKAASSEKYIDGAEISYVSNSTESVWRHVGKKYYWPKNGQLTFFAWTNVREYRGVSGITYTFSSDDYIKGVTVDATNGVKIADYDVTYVNPNTSVGNKNTDILVADIKADQTKNLTNDYGNFGKTDNADRVDKRESRYTGVPTLFKHKLSKVYFTAKTDKDYETTDGIKFYVNSIVFKNIAKQGTYTQGVDATSCVGSWTTVANTDPQSYFSGNAGVAGTEVNSTVKDIFNIDSQYYYMPQTFGDDAIFVVTYSIDYGNGVKEENLTQTCKLKANNLASFDISKFYTINLTFTLNEILWDPAVEEWETGTANVDINK